jgi:hypothetical protein
LFDTSIKILAFSPGNETGAPARHRGFGTGYRRRRHRLERFSPAALGEPLEAYD